ncbi:MAG: hypothetical protein PCFJNLEI_01089 [Verrucomicrobiae bacterium]|nr:hypothetical protein [Verrucomicrobiae bacterium]
MNNFLRWRDWLSIVVVLVLVIVVAQQRRTIAGLRDTVQGLSAKANTPPVVVAPPPVVPVAVPATEPEVPAAPVPPAPAAPATPAPNMFARFRDMAKDPAFKDMMRAQQKMAMAMTYGALFKKLELTGDDLTDFKTLLADRQVALMETGMALMGGGTGDRMKRAQEAQQVKAAHDKKIEEFLGTEGYEIFKGYEDTQAERMQVNMFKHSLAGTEALTEQQEQDLIAVMYEERKRLPVALPTQNTVPDPAQFTPEKVTEMGKQLEELQVRNLERAATILTPAQLEQFKAGQERMRVMQTMGIKMAAQMFSNQGDAAPAKP